MRSDKDKTSQAAQGAIDEDMLLQHIAALNAKLTVAFEKKIEPLGNQIIAYKEVVAPLSQDLKRNLAQMEPLFQQIQSLQATLTSSIQSADSDRQTVGTDLAALRSELTTTFEAISSQMAEVKTAAETPPADTSGPIVEQLQAIIARLDTLESGMGAATEATTAAVSQLNPADSIEGLRARLDAVEYQLQSDISSAFSNMLDTNQKLLAGLEQKLETPDSADDEGQSGGLGGEVAELREQLHASLGRIELMQTEFNGSQAAAFDTTKQALQSDISQAFSAWLESNQTLLDKVDALSERLSGMDEQIQAREVANTPVEPVYQPVSDNLPDVIRDRVDEVHTRLTNSDWALQSIGKNMTTLMHEISAMRDDVLSSSMARRTYNAVEDIRALVEDLPRRSAPTSQDAELAARLEATLENVRSAISASPDSLASTLEVAKNEILDTLKSSSDSMSGPIDSSRQEILSAVETLRSLNTEIGGQISQSIASHSQQLVQQVEKKFSELEAGRSSISRTMASIEQAALQRRSWTETYTGSRPAPLQGYDGSKAIEQLKTENPAVFKHWYAAFQNGAACYTEARSSNCSTLGNSVARTFRDYLSLFAKGAILDIGCGPYGDPGYLVGLPNEQLTGLEPLDVINEERFPIIRGVNEFLPWPDQSFDTVVTATSLDHVLDLRKALSESHRVLKADGLYVLWYADVEGADNILAKPPAKQKAIDKYHLFHIDESWFSDAIGEWFDLVDYRRFQHDGPVADVFAVYRPRPAAKVPAAKRKAASRAKPKRKTTGKTGAKARK